MKFREMMKHLQRTRKKGKEITQERVAFKGQTSKNVIVLGSVPCLQATHYRHGHR